MVITRFTNKNRWSYQDEAIKEIKTFFKSNTNKKGMLVIPTGGGKTLTALRAINELFNENLIVKKVLWVSHLKTLNTQTINVLKKQLKKDRFLGSLELEKVNPLLKNVKPQMVKEAGETIKLNKKDYDFIVVDEAHHAPAQSYRLILGSGLPILGLTATPIRLDGLSMPFKPVFQITPAELFHRGVIIQPELKSYETKLTYDIDDISADNQFNILNNDTRNRFVAEKIFNNKKRYSKTIVFVRTKEHAKELKRFFSQENFKTKHYEKIGYILGGDENDEGIKNDEYLEKNKKYKTSIIINCGVLTEGFDDPSINTTVMACPSKSTTFIMQCVGRALRRNPSLGDGQKKYMVTFSDNLPNVNYRFDNFWAFGEIDDYLEPNIEKIEYDSKESFYKQIEEVFKNKPGLNSFCKKIDFKTQKIDYDLLKSSSLMLYNYSAEDYGEKWGLIYFNSLDGKILYLEKTYNWLVLNVKKYSSGKIDVPSVLLKRGLNERDKFLGTTAAKQNFWDSIEKSYQLIKKRGNEIRKINRLYYYSFFERKDLFKEELELFVSESINKDSVINKIEGLDKHKTYWVILVPYTIIGGIKTFIIEEKTKEEILNTINYFKKITQEKKPSEYKKIIEEKNVTYFDVERSEIQFEQILQIISDKNRIYREENTFLKVYQNQKK